MDELQAQLTLGMVIPYVMQWLKSQAWFPLASLNNGTLNRITTGALALASGFGLAGHYDNGVLTITGLTLANIYQGVLHSITAFALQHSVYKAAIAPPLAGAVQAAQRDAGVVKP